MGNRYENFSGYVLAGGESSRMGTDKAFLEFKGKTFLENAVDILKPVCGNRIKAILNPSRKGVVSKLPESLSHIFDIVEGRGPLGGIHAALADCDTEFALVLAVDLPLVEPGLIRDLAGELEKGEFDAVFPSLVGKQFLPLCGGFRADRSYENLTDLFDNHKRLSVRQFLKSLNSKELNVRSEDQFLNTNTQEDLTRLDIV